MSARIPRRRDPAKLFLGGHLVFLGSYWPDAQPKNVGEATRMAAPYLLFVGEGELEARLKARVAEAPPSAQARVRFLGFKGQRELPAYLDLADVLALPSLREPWGLIVNEAMCAGAAILVSDRVGATPDLVRDGGNGRVVPAGDVAALRAALAELVFDPERLAQMGTRSREIIAGWSYDQDIDGLKAALSALYPGRL